MKLSTASHTSIVSTIKQALEKYASADKNIITDIHLQPCMASGKRDSLYHCKIYPRQCAILIM